MQYHNLVILLGYRKDKLAETRLVESQESPKQMVYMAEMDDKITSIEELRVQSNGTTIYWQTHRVSELKPFKD
tara:strand:+ start:46 stop:264 length:219 start_codon:yes stop_codon:yes gene_type:complete